MSIPKDKLLRAYRQMKTIREFEERAHAEIMNCLLYTSPSPRD